MRHTAIKVLASLAVFALGYGVLGTSTAWATGSTRTPHLSAAPDRHCC
jgi:hypothetical protein